jgi:hypothetical protein
LLRRGIGKRLYTFYNLPCLFRGALNVKSSIEVSVQFDFKGKTLKPTATVDLDMHMQQYGQMPEWHHLLARENEIGFYSYEFEVLESIEPEFHHATGLAADFVSEGRFDAEGFVHCWQEQQTLGLLQDIAKRHMGVDELASQPGLKSALLEAYEIGRQGAEG